MKNVQIICVSLLALFCVSLQAATLPKTAKLVPPETIILIETDNFSQLQTQFEKTAVYKLYKDPSMAAFITNVKEVLKKETSKLDDNNLLKVFYNAGLWPTGKVSLSVVLDNRTKDLNEPPILILAQWGEKIDKIKEAVKKLEQKNIDIGGRQKPAEDYRGINIQTLIDELKAPLSYCFVDDCLLMSPDLESIKFAVAHIKGSESPTLADDSDYTSSQTAVGPNHDVDIFVNIKQLIKMAASEDKSGEAKKLISNLGLDNVKCLSGAIGMARLSAGGTVGKMLLKIDGEKKGVCKIFEMRTASLAVPSFVPASAYTVSIFNLDAKSAFDELVKIVTAFSPGAASIFYTPIVPATEGGGPAIELKKDMLDYLGSQIIVAQWQQGESKTVYEPQSFVAVAISNRSTIERNLSVLHTRFTNNKPDAKRELLGHTIYIVDLLSLLMGSAGASMTTMIEVNPQMTNPQAPKLAFTVSDTHLIIGTESAVESVIRSQASAGTPSLNSQKWFNTAKSAIPSSAGLAGFENYTAVYEKIWEIFRQGTDQQKSQALNGSIESAAGELLQLSAEDMPFDFKLLPAFDKVRKFFGLVVSYALSRPDGFYFEFRYIGENP